MSQSTPVTQLIREAICRKLRDIPPLPQVVGELMTELQNDDSTTANKLEALIMRDPALAAKTLKVVNSAYYGLSRKVLNIGQAVVILGTQQLRSLLMSLAAVSMLQARTSRQRALQQTFWEHSIATAHCASLLCSAKNSPGKEAEVAFVGGLLHEIGRLFLFTHLPDTYQKVADHAHEKGIRLGEVEKAVLGISHDEVGLELARMWQFPETLEAFVCGHEGPFDENSPASLMAVHAAHSRVEALFQTRLDAGEMDPFVAAWLGFEEADWEAILEETFKKMQGQFEALTAVAA
jgi:putative nucleotidyltransferase with HDIG domain